MTAPASIPNLRPGFPQPIAKAAPRIPSFERLRPRSRVVVLSRRPARARYLRIRAHSEVGSRRLPSNPTTLDPISPGNINRTCSIQREAATQTGYLEDRLDPSRAISDLDEGKNEHSNYSTSATNASPFDVSPQNPESLARPGSGNCDGISHIAVFDGQNGTTLTNTPKQPLDLPRMYIPCETGSNQKPLRPSSTEPICGNPSRFTNTLGRFGVDSLLVEAITRNVVQQLQMLSVSSEPRSHQHPLKDSEEQSPESYRNPSRTSSQREALDRFTRELQRYTERSGARGKLPVFTPTPTKSGATLRTISALVPFRSEFKAAGLAVTSKDQARTHHHRTKPNVVPTARPPLPKFSIKEAHLSQVDGNDGCCPSSNTEISFLTPTNADEWRHAMMEKAKPRRHQKPFTNKPAKPRCLPCIPSHHDSTDSGCLQLLQKSQYQVHAGEQHVASNIVSKIPKLPAKARVPGWEHLPIPHIAYPNNHRHGPRTETSHPAARGLQAGSKKECPSPAVSGPGQSITATGLRRQSMALPQQGTEAVSPRGNRSAERHNLQRRRTRPVRLTSTPIATSRIPHMESLNRQKPAHHSPRRYQSAPAYDTTKDLQKVKPYLKPLPDLPSTPKQDINSFSGVKLVAESTTKMPPQDGGVAEVTTSSQGKNYYQPEPPASPQHVTPGDRADTSRIATQVDIPQRISSIKGSLQSANWEDCDSEVMDRDVLKGLHVAASAACDERVDALIRQETGLRIRKLLVSLMPFENMGDKLVADAKQRRASRRANMREVKRRVRRSRELQKATMPFY
ncbi:hypothetical protein B0J13DRAFT_559118 [Dactylonectria estremocensis]|uniref:Uncharacterized protein n=1 Tax=Dactylonectria estremocensis TaxID=1079267 RepID=A0A9P9J005_9HYPO|nr:hypothetical protein B0J13DRAFT_559118 [Dactylonectria estremocensis]